MIALFIIVLACLLLGYVIIDWSTCKKIVYRFPTLANYAKTIYQDDEGKCYQYYPVTMACPRKI